MNNVEGVNWYEEDKGRGPFILRKSGTTTFVSKIDSRYYSRFGTPSPSVDFVLGWDNPSIIRFGTLADAVYAAREVYKIEGFHISVETVDP